jgi:tetratricopeptide (TPR) repeat protein
MMAGRSSPTGKPLTRRFRSLALLGVLALGVALVPVPARGDALSDGKKALKEGRVDEAVALLRQAAKADPASAPAQIALGQALERRRRWEEALVAFQAGSRLDPRSSEAQRGQGAALTRLGRLEEAVKAYREATALDRRFPEAQLALGDVLVQLERYDEAVAVLKEGLKWGPKTRPYFNEGLGRAEAARGNLKDAEVYLLSAREASPTTPRFHRALGDLYSQRKIPDLAVVSYQQAISLDPDDLDSRFAMARAMVKASRYNEALDQYKAIVARDSTYEEAYKEMGDIYLKASDQNPAFIDDALHTLQTYSRLVPEDPDGAALLARTYYKLGRRDEAMAILDPLGTAGKLTPNGHAIYARALYDKQRYEAAVAEYRLAAKKLEDNDYLRFAHALWASGSPAAADSIYLSRWEADSTADKDRVKASDWILQRAKLRYQVAKRDTARARAEYGAAIPFFQRKIELDPNSEEAYYYMGLSLRELQRFEEAQPALLKAVELAPAKADRHFWLGVNYDKLGQKAEVRREFEEVARLDSTTTLGAIARQQMGYYRLLEKDWQGAARFLESSVAIDPKQVQTWVWLGQACQNAGQRSRAIEAYRQALELDPRQADARNGLQQLTAP